RQPCRPRGTRAWRFCQTKVGGGEGHGAARAARVPELEPVAVEEDANLCRARSPRDRGDVVVACRLEVKSALVRLEWPYADDVVGVPVSQHVLTVLARRQNIEARPCGCDLARAVLADEVIRAGPEFEGLVGRDEMRLTIPG